jgi:hypothetical protein
LQVLQPLVQTFRRGVIQRDRSSRNRLSVPGGPVIVPPLVGAQDP